ncbi:MAG: HAMP domain-containing histidine kinase [Beijerinckiaceae bacterium]|nr:HAMP domain-containing histidine kinase [Beijerinckiaceae bacterium]MDO9440248.1 HAMP domain-containing sensor histidine kinase [Beijerinckiaceae bacterium]
MRDQITSQSRDRKRRLPRIGLAGRVLFLIVSFVMLAEVAIYVPSIANFRENWLRDRLSAAYTAVLVIEASPQVPENLLNDVLASVRADTIVLKMHDSRRLLAQSDMPPRIDERYDLRNAGAFDAIGAAFRTLAASNDRILGVVGPAPMGGDYIEITMSEAPLREAMWAYSANILLLSLVISVVVASLAAIAIHLLMLRPMRRLTSSIIRFGSAPEDASRVIRPSGAEHEIGRAEEALADMQRALARELAEKKHLAALGLAVAKVSHDLRNILSSAQLLSDRLSTLSDPLARRLAPKLVGTLDRAIAFCQSTLTYGRAVERPPELQNLPLRLAVVEAAEIIEPDGPGRVALRNEVAPDIEILGDPEQIFRVLLNIFRNAYEALETAGPQPGRPAEVTITAAQRDGFVVVEISDTGPGIPESAKNRLFEPFKASSRPGGTGLGLAIAADLVKAHGGTITLLPSQPGQGATFRLTLPAPAVEADPRRVGSQG